MSLEVCVISCDPTRRQPPDTHHVVPAHAATSTTPLAPPRLLRSVPTLFPAPPGTVFS
jgi:hypothetical protein